jgi:peptide/nickel transport system substrate-binding protein
MMRGRNLHILVVATCVLSLVLAPGCALLLDNDPEVEGTPQDVPTGQEAAEVRYNLDAWGSAGVQGGTLRIAGAAPPHYRAWNAASTDVSSVVDLLHTPLVRRNQATLAFEPALAEGFVIGDNDRSVTVTLRSDLQWSDGEALDANDVLFTVEDLLLNDAVDSDTDLTVAGETTSWSKVDDLTFTVTSTKPYAAWPRLISVSVLPQHILEPVLRDQGPGAVNEMWNDQTAASELVGSGPFRVKTRSDHGAQLTLEANPYYFEADGAGTALPYLDELVLVPGSASQLLLDGSVDVADLSGSALGAVDGAADIRVFNAGIEAGSDFLAINQNPIEGPEDEGLAEPALTWLSTKAFRQALAHVIDRSTLVESMYSGYGEARYSPIHPASPYYWSGAPDAALTYDLDAARALLDGLDWTDTDEDGVREDSAGNPIELTLNTNQGNSTRESVIADIAQEARKVGISITDTPIPFSDLVDKLTSSYDWELIVVGLTASPDPIAASNSIPSYGDLHVIEPNQDSPRRIWEQTVDEAWETASTDSDTSVRQSAYKTIQETWLDELPWIYTISEQVAVAAGRSLGNLEEAYVHPFDAYLLRGLLTRLYLE